MLNSIDLFAGCGGMTLGFAWAGFNSVLASDIDENCRKTFATNFPEIPFICGDISSLRKDDFDSIVSMKEIDVIIGGPPCQGFSLANKKRNIISEDPRNKLFYDFVKTINWYNPKAFVMENVKGLLSMESGKVINQI
ncbi:MAG: DNA (cytosine-5-)-methyltransferase [Bacteroidales bacterium]|jgi:DNA (cytosine-5)-methyltransferase 1|nr:DNA (cytosine-5-)-methyltransferase [Bacteroidales bacterium]